MFPINTIVRIEEISVKNLPTYKYFGPKCLGNIYDFSVLGYIILFKINMVKFLYGS